MPIYRVDYLLRGIYIPAGAKEVVFSFTLPSYAWGRWIDFVFGLVILLFLLAAGLRHFLQRKRELIALQEEGMHA